MKMEECVSNQVKRCGRDRDVLSVGLPLRLN